MATLVTCTINEAGPPTYNYASLTLAESSNFGATGADLVTNDEYVEATITGTWTSAESALAMDCFATAGYTDATRNLTIEATGSARSGAVWNSNAWRSGMLTNTIQFVKYIGLQVNSVGTACVKSQINSTDSRDLEIHNCLLKGDGSNTIYGIQTLNTSGSYGSITITRNIIYDIDDTTNGTTIDCQDYATALISNNTCIGARDYSIYMVDLTAVTVENNLAEKVAGSDFVQTGCTVTANNNATSDATGDDFGGLNNRINQTFTFRNAGADDYRLAKGCLGAFRRGKKVDGITTDISGNTITNYSIGADDGPLAKAAADLSGLQLGLEAYFECEESGATDDLVNAWDGHEATHSGDNCASVTGIVNNGRSAAKTSTTPAFLATRQPFDVGSSFTYCGWFKFSATSSYPYLLRMSTLDGGTKFWSLYRHNSGYMGSNWGATSYGYTTLTPSNTTWVFLCLRYDSNANTLKCTLNSTTETKTSVGAMTGTWNQCYYLYNNASGITVDIDEVAIWSRALSDSEVSDLYASGSPGGWGDIEDDGVTAIHDTTVAESGSPDYATLLLADSNNFGLSTGDIVSIDKVPRCKIQGSWSSAESSSVTIDAITTGDMLRRLIIQTEGDATHNGSWDTGAYRIEGTTNCLYGNSVPFLEIHGVQVSGSSSGAYVIYMVSGAQNSNLELHNTIAKGDGTNTLYGIRMLGDASYLCEGLIRNCISYDHVNATDGAGITLGAIDGTVENCTCYGSDYGIRYSSAQNADVQNHCINTICDTNATADFSTLSRFATEDYNLASDTTTSGSNSLNSQNPTYANEGSRDLHLTAGTAGVDDGYDLTEFWARTGAIDIDGASRVGLTWDIGADEVTGAASQSQAIEQATWTWTVNDLGATLGAVSQAIEQATWTWTINDVGATYDVPKELEQATWTWTVNDLGATVGAVSQALEQATWTWTINDLGSVADQAQALEQATWTWTVNDLGATYDQSQALDQATWTWTVNDVNTGETQAQALGQATWEWNVRDLFGYTYGRSRIDRHLGAGISDLRRSLAKPFIVIFGQRINCVPSRKSLRHELQVGGRRENLDISFVVDKADMPSWITVDDTGITIDDSETVDAFGYNPRSGNVITFENQVCRIRDVESFGTDGHVKLNCYSIHV